jgi:V8-like Glu-specific endopeptidase
MPTQDLNQVVTNPQQLSAEEAYKVEQYWTPDMMESAEPIPLPTVYMPQHLLRLLDQSAEVLSDEASPIVSESVPPDIDDAVPTSANFNTRLVPDLTQYPYAVVGKWFMTFAGRNFVGTGWVIGERTVFTAGHCVFDRNSAGWATNVLFRAQFNNGAQVGEWALPSLASLRGWTENEDFVYDMAMGVAARPIRPVTGKAGYIANVGQIQGQIKSIGYPAEVIPGFDFNGRRMWECDGTYIDTQNQIMAMNNNMTGGCSGGPGMYRQSDRLYAIWVNSFRFRSEPNILRSPYFGRGFTNLIQWMRDNGGDS